MTAVRLGQAVGVEVGFFEKVALRLDMNNEDEQPSEELGLLTSHSLPSSASPITSKCLLAHRAQLQVGPWAAYRISWIVIAIAPIAL